LPGFGLDLNCYQVAFEEGIFYSALDNDLNERGLCESRCVGGLSSPSPSPVSLLFFVRMPFLTLREIAMLQLMDKITDEHEWQRKVSSFFCLACEDLHFYFYLRFLMKLSPRAGRFKLCKAPTLLKRW
jgi:hypothetical protein